MLSEQQQRILGYFIEEARDHLNTIEQGLLNLQGTLNDPEMINEVFRAAHSIKGGSAMLGLSSIQRTAHRLEDCFKILKDNPIQVDQKLESLFLGVSDTLKALLEHLSGPFGLTEEIANTLMSETEPVFGWLHEHLETLVVQQGGVFESDAPKVVVAPAQPQITLEQLQTQALQYLREMLQIFKQPATPQNRQELETYCDRLAQSGAQLNLTNWCEMCRAAGSAVINPDHSYLNLAKIIITEIKQALELVMANRDGDITISPQLAALIEVPEIDLLELDTDLFNNINYGEENDNYQVATLGLSGTEINDIFADADAANETSRDTNLDVNLETHQNIDNDSIPDLQLIPEDEISNLGDIALDDGLEHNLENSLGNEQEENNLGDSLEDSLGVLDSFTTDEDSFNSDDEINSLLELDTQDNYNSAFQPPVGIEIGNYENVNDVPVDVAFSDTIDDLSQIDYVSFEDSFADSLGDSLGESIGDGNEESAIAAILDQDGPEVGIEELTELDELFKDDAPELDENWSDRDGSGSLTSAVKESTDSHQTDNFGDSEVADLLRVEDSTSIHARQSANHEEMTVVQLFGNFLDDDLDGDDLNLEQPPISPFDANDDGHEMTMLFPLSDDVFENEEGTVNHFENQTPAEPAQPSPESVSTIDEIPSEIPNESIGQEIDEEITTLQQGSPPFPTISDQSKENLVVDGGFEANPFAADSVESNLGNLNSDNSNSDNSNLGEIDNLENLFVDALTPSPVDNIISADANQVFDDFWSGGEEIVTQEQIAQVSHSQDDDIAKALEASLFAATAQKNAANAIADLNEQDSFVGDSFENDSFVGDSFNDGNFNSDVAVSDSFHSENINLELDLQSIPNFASDRHDDANEDKTNEDKKDDDDIFSDFTVEDINIPANSSGHELANPKLSGLSEQTNHSVTDDSPFPTGSILGDLDLAEDLNITENGDINSLSIAPEFEFANSLSANNDELFNVISPDNSQVDNIQVDDIQVDDIFDFASPLTTEIQTTEIQTRENFPNIQPSEDLITSPEFIAAASGEIGLDLPTSTQSQALTTNQLFDKDLVEEDLTDEDLGLDEITQIQKDDLNLDFDSLADIPGTIPGTIPETDILEREEKLEIDADSEFAAFDEMLMDAPELTIVSEFPQNDISQGENLEEEISVSQLAPETAPEEDAADPFADLDALLESKLNAVTNTNPENNFGGDGSLDSEFAALEQLLDATPAPTPVVNPAPTPIATPASSGNSLNDEFSELERMLVDADQLISPASPTNVAKPQRTPPRRAVRFEQLMKVPVKHLDDLSNLVGELVVNRNTLEQDQERMRQSLDNLLHQVQQLSDVGARMQELYERSLLEASLLASRSNGGFGHGGGNNADSDRGFSELEMDRFTPFHTLSQEMIELIVRVRESASDIDFVTEETERVARQFRQVTTQLQEGLTRSRMVPFSQVTDRVRRGVRDNAIKCGKQVELLIEGQDTLIDKMILEHLTDPLTHMLNNAIAHGIETPNERQSKGKSDTGTISVRAFHQGNQTVISVADDGAGIDPEKVKAKAVRMGLVSPEQGKTLTRSEIYDLLFQSGFSTKDQADDLAGRGVGMDVVRTSISEIRGTITTDSRINKGTSFTIRLPLTLSICKALCCVSDRARIAFPMDGVEDTLDISAKQIQKGADDKQYIIWRDTQLPFKPLKDILTLNRQLSRGNVYGGNRDDDMISVVVVRSGNTMLALQVDLVLSEQEIVIKQFEGPAPKPIGVAGATVLGDGRIMAIADVLEIIDIFQGRTSKQSSISWEPPAANTSEHTGGKIDPTVLIVDDSITVRELLSLTFSKAGYRVEQARDGQEAWDKLRSGLPCDIVFCDIEMPRCDGLELLSRIQKEPSLNHLPIAMLTSRGADKHRQMAISLGASGYFTKPYLEEALLEAASRMLKGENLVAG